MPQGPYTEKLRAFLDLVGWSEGTTTHPATKCNGYDVIVSGVDGHHTFTDFATHPFSLGRPPIVVRDSVPPLLSTASGRYQIILPTWLDLAGKHHLGSFTPANQDAAALSLLAECRAYEAICNDRIPEAIEAASETWASFPGNLFHQGGHDLHVLLETYNRLLLTPAT
jgi:muramidase (phage lysozyme)